MLTRVLGAPKWWGPEASALIGLVINSTLWLQIIYRIFKIQVGQSNMEDQNFRRIMSFMITDLGVSGVADYESIIGFPIQYGRFNIPDENFFKFRFT